MSVRTRWGVCATVKADTRDILRFAAHYLDAGAHRVWVCLDAPNPEAEALLTAHPHCRVTMCDAAYWTSGFGHRPKKHQVRQGYNATRIYGEAAEVDWLLHADVDEFLIGPHPVAEVLGTLPAYILTARVRPIEALASEPGQPGPRAFKAFLPAGPARQRTVEVLYPRFGHCVKGGFLSHVAGKVLLRTGHKDMSLRIHNVFRGEEMNPGAIGLDTLALAHLHAADWSTWRACFGHRLEQGAYRSELAPARPAAKGGRTLHDVLSDLLAREGETGLRDFFEEIARDTPALRERLQKHGLLILHDLDLDGAVSRHFPEHRASAATV